jgi:hypothetical protein
MDVVLRGDPHSVGGALLVGDVDLRRREITDEDHGESRDDAGAVPEAHDSRAHVVQHLLGYGFAVEDQAATRSRRMDVARPVSGSTAITTP